MYSIRQNYQMVGAIFLAENFFRDIIFKKMYTHYGKNQYLLLRAEYIIIVTDESITGVRQLILNCSISHCMVCDKFPYNNNI